jgi:hypothetical protein
MYHFVEDNGYSLLFLCFLAVDVDLWRKCILAEMSRMVVDQERKEFWRDRLSTVLDIEGNILLADDYSIQVSDSRRTGLLPYSVSTLQLDNKEF